MGPQRIVVGLLLLAVTPLAWVSDASAEQAASNVWAFQQGRIDAGGSHTCAISSRGELRCWGNGAGGRLGYANTNTIGDDETPGSVGPVDLGAGRSGVAITAGGAHTCALLDNGTVRCWGAGADGQLGYANTNNIGDTETPGSVDPVDLGAGGSAVAITAGESHTCALLDDGTVRCWGLGSLGRLGYGNSTDIGDSETPGSVGPVDLGTGRSAVAITAGGAHTCALLDNGTVRCWGAGANGQLGYGNTTTIGDTEAPGSVGPVDLGAGRSAVAVTAGSSHTCALLDNGTVRCWGHGFNGQLGYGNTTTIGDTETPGSVGPVDLGAGRSAVAITAGEFHTCAVLENGTLRCWGFGGFGSLGYANPNSIGDNETPGSAGPVDLGAGRSAVAITAGSVHNCALLDNGTMRCWGIGGFGRLGYGNTTHIGDNETPGSVGPVNTGFSLGAEASQVDADSSHTCALLDNGTVRCWGSGADGRLGYGNTDDIGDNEVPWSAGPVDLGTGRSAVAISTGAFHTCALLDNGTVRCWGDGASGKLGYGNTTDIGDDESPGSVGPVDLGTGRSAVAISVGAVHTCALLDNGTVRCWGLDGLGRLGYGTTTNIGDTETPGAVGPVDLGAGRSAVAISAGGDHTCAVLDNGTVRCWGFGAHGRLGYGNTDNIGDTETPGTVGPVDLGAGRSAVGIAAGGHTCAVLDDGTVRCWGEGANGRLGYGNTNNIGDNETPGSVGPVNVGTGRSAVAITAAGTHTCAVLDNGTVRCWGAGAGGKLGYGSTFDVPAATETPGSVPPVDLGTGRSAVAMSAGDDHTCALLEIGAVRCWGLGADGRLGYGNTTTIGDNETPGSAGPVDLFDDPPVAIGDAATVGEDSGATAIGVLANDTDVDGGPKTIVAKAEGADGTVVITGGGSGLTYQPDADYCGPDTFTYTLNGGATVTVSVTVNCVDDDPLAIDDAVTVDEDSGATAVAVLPNDTDVDGGPQTIASKTDGANGTVVITGGGTGLSYQPNPNYCGPDAFTYALNGGSTATVNLTVTCVDDDPLAVDDMATVGEDSGATALAVLVNDTDVDGGQTIATKTDGVHGTVAITGGSSGLTYQPDPSYCGADAFTYALNGGSRAAVTVTVTCIDDSPVAVGDSKRVKENSKPKKIDVLANDTDGDGGPKSVTSATKPAHGKVKVTGGTALTYKPKRGYCNTGRAKRARPDTFTYALNGGSTATVSVKVRCR